MAKNTKNEKKSIENADNSAQGLLKRLSRRYDADRIASEKNAMKKLDERYETDSHSHDVVAYHTTTEMPAASEDGGVISEAEFKKLYLKYLGKRFTTAGDTSSYLFATFISIFCISRSIFSLILGSPAHSALISA